MADNTTLNPGTGGDVIATEDIVGVKIQRVKMVLGAVDSDDGDVSTVNPVPVSGIFFQSTQPVSGTVNVGNFPATQPISGTVNIGNLPATQPVTGTVNIGNFPAIQPASQSGSWYIQAINSTLTVNSPNASNFLATIVGTVTANQSNASNFLATVSQGSANWTVDHQKIVGTTIDVNSGSKSAGTQRVVLATDQPQLTNKLLVTPDANSSFNLSQVLGTTADVNSGNKSAGTLRVVLATDQPALSNKLLVTPDSNIAMDLARIQGQASVASVAGVLDVMPRKRTGATGLSPNYISGRISTSTTTTLVNATCYLSSLHMTCVNPGTTWALKVQNGEATAKVIVPNFVLNANFGGSGVFVNPISYDFSEPIVCTSGINVVTVGGTTGNVDYFATYWQ